MSIRVLMPALSPTMTEGNLVKWNKAEGDLVKAGDVIAEIETDKATMEVESVDEGVLGKILVPAGTEGVQVNSLIAVLLEEGEGPEVLETLSLETAPSSSPAETDPSSEIAASSPVSQSPKGSSENRVFASPLARRLAAQKGIALDVLEGSGPRGRIVKADVESYRPKTTQSFDNQGPAYEDVPLSSMRKVIAKRLTESKQTVPHFYLTVDCILDNLLKARKELAVQDLKFSVNDFVIKACAMALQKVPEANACWMETAVRYFKSSDISVAVAIEGGLVTPIIREAHAKSMKTISAEMKELADKAKQGKLKPEEFQGGNFSLSNLGMYGIDNFAAIINPPQACILAVGAGVQKPVVSHGQIEVATVMTVTLSVDHRVVDGAIGANFLKAFKGFIEHPLSMMV